VETVLDSFNLFFNSRMMYKILSYTNQYAFSKEPSWKNIEISEFKVFIGLLILLGVYKARHEPIREIFSGQDGRSIFGNTMKCGRFELILRYLRFDSRNDRDKNEKDSAIKEVFELFRTKLPKGIIPGENLTVDEQLVNFYGRCGFKSYIPSKPGKFGIKLWLLCDSKTGYCFNQIIYTGKKRKDDKPEKNLGVKVVLDILKTCVVNFKGRTLVTDNFFTSLSLAEELYSKKLTLVGTMKNSRKELPPQFTIKKKRDRYSSLFAFKQRATLVSYLSRKKKVVNLLSSLHNSVEIGSTVEKKPHIIDFYNQNKCGVDTFDKNVKMYTTRRKSRRWTLVIFLNCLDTACYNAYITYATKFPFQCNKSDSRRKFLIELGKKLIEHEEQIFPLKIGLVSKLSKRKRCSFCKDKDRKTSTLCNKCNGPICKEHSLNICSYCLK